MPNHPEDIRKESLICRKWNFKTNISSDHADGILVTGANSFIGSHVISSLSDISPGPVHLLIRAPNFHEAVVKMQNAFSQWDLGEFEHEKYIIHVGDVGCHMMNLDAGEYHALKKIIGFVVHLAMTPLYHLPYQHFKRVWIPELERMISFCGDPKSPKSLHYTSSFNANFFQTNADFKALNSNAWQSGYAGFKWVANQTLLNAMHKNLRGCIYDLPLVVGSEKNGLCPSHYSIWHILDIFLKTGYFFEFSFNIIPVDILAKIIVYNILKDKNDLMDPFLRPVLQEPLTDRIFSRTVANILGLKLEELEVVRKSCKNKLRFDFMVPGNFYDLMDKVRNLPAVFPDGFDTTSLPSTAMVFLSNLNRILSKKFSEKVIKDKIPVIDQTNLIKL